MFSLLIIPGANDCGKNNAIPLVIPLGGITFVLVFMVNNSK